MEDILEEIVGEIHDEYDDGGGKYSASARSECDYRRFYSTRRARRGIGHGIWRPGDGDFERYLTYMLDHIPTIKDKEVIANGYRFEILSVENNTIQKVKARKLPSAAQTPLEEKK